jgi:ribonuclease HI
MPFRKHPSLFSPETAPESCVVARIDGGARGNPGPAAYGVVLEDEAGARLAELSEYLGRRTNNYAEYAGLLAALEYCAGHGLRRLRVLSDSELLVRQLTGRYKVRSAELRPLYERAQGLIRALDWFRVEHVRREKNREADRLVNKTLDRHTAGAE